MSSYPYSQSSHFVELLNSQQESGSIFLCVALGSSQPPVFSSQANPEDPSFIKDKPTERRSDYSNEQKLGAFWKHSDYFAASPKAAEKENREPEPIQCKQQWQKINDVVCKFSGSYEAETRKKSSGQNENDVLKLAHEIFCNDHKNKFTLDHAWKELRNDQKW
ncbi:glutathione S-transferase T3-like [Eutrema salsugineum]|uniref:glutathione S-transferase T3-like n=1 Tax=Eutrema salsugineum TaxID=72664 RepID=UPI000CED0E70|nr:glutathione S-transferase T3-like [Eutrema salsugineum]